MGGGWQPGQQIWWITSYERPDGTLGFHALPPPTDEDVEQITARIVARIIGLVAHRDGDALEDEPDALADAQAEAAQLPMPLAEPPPRTSGSRRYARNASQPHRARPSARVHPASVVGHLQQTAPSIAAGLPGSAAMWAMGGAPLFAHR